MPSLRTFPSYSVLILVPVVSITIAILPYWWVKRKYKPVQWRHLWITFVIGLVGNVEWWWIVGLRPAKFSLYTGDTETTGVLFGFFLYSFFIIATPFIFSRIYYGTFTLRRTVISALCSFLTAGAVLGVWIILAIIGYRGIFYQLN